MNDKEAHVQLDGVDELEVLSRDLKKAKYDLVDVETELKQVKTKIGQAGDIADQEKLQEDQRVLNKTRCRLPENKKTIETRIHLPRPGKSIFVSSWLRYLYLLVMNAALPFRRTASCLSNNCVST